MASELATASDVRRWLEAILADVRGDEQSGLEVENWTAAIASVLATKAELSGGVVRITARELAEAAGLPPWLAGRTPRILTGIGLLGWLEELAEDPLDVPHSYALRMSSRVEREAHG